MTLLLATYVMGLPATQGSKSHVGKGRIVDSCRRLGVWRDQVAIEARRRVTVTTPTSAPVTLRVAFFLPRPLAHYVAADQSRPYRTGIPQYPATRPDLTKMVRAVEDALAGIVYVDDSQVVEQATSKHYAMLRDTVGCSIDVSEVYENWFVDRS